MAIVVLIIAAVGAVYWKRRHPPLRNLTKFVFCSNVILPSTFNHTGDQIQGTIKDQTTHPLNPLMNIFMYLSDHLILRRMFTSQSQIITDKKYLQCLAY